MKTIRHAAAILALTASGFAVAADKPEATPAAGSVGKIYTVADGNKVDENTLKGWKTWRAQACERCHGANQEGAVGPSLIDSMKSLSKADFKETLLKGRLDKGMPNFSGAPQVVENIDNLYAFLKGRSDGDIKPGRLQVIEK